QENGSLAAVVYSLSHLHTFRHYADTVAMASGGMLIFLPLFLGSLFFDLKRGLPAGRAAQTTLLGSYFAFTLAVPATVDSSALVLNLAMLPLLGLFWTQSRTQTERVGVLLAAIGSGLTQSQSLMFSYAVKVPIAQMIPAFGGLLLVVGLCIHRVGGQTIF